MVNPTPEYNPHAEDPGLENTLGNQAGREYVSKMNEAADFIRNRVCGQVPDTLVVLGSGLGGFADGVEKREVIPYGEIPHFHQSSTEGHAGDLIIGDLDGNEIACFAGRVHCHDGLKPSEVAFSSRVMESLGVEYFFISNAAGSLNPNMNVGDFVVLENHISLFLPEDPSFGLEHPQLGDKFYDQTDPYDPELRALFLEVANELGYGDKCHEGTYCFLPGPRYESRGDIRLLMAIAQLSGMVDTVGMSTVPEVLSLLQQGHGNKKIFAVSSVTNQAAGLSDKKLSHDEVKEEGNEAAPMLQAIITEVLKRKS